MAIVMDSDKRSAESDINATKKRILDEFATGGGIAWVTAGRTIENYMPLDRLGDAIKCVHPKAVRVSDTPGRYDYVFRFEPSSTTSRPPLADKVEVARKLVESELPLDVLDLKSRVNELSAFIRQANGL
jgi:hypothetical protein